MNRLAISNFMMFIFFSLPLIHLNYPLLTNPFIINSAEAYKLANLTSNDDDFNASESLTDIMRDLLILSMNQTNGKLSPQCESKLNDIILNNKSNYILKIYTDSSKILNNIGGYEDCSLNAFNDNVHISEDFNYGVVRIRNKDNPGSIEFDCGAVIMGVCFLKVCNEDDIGNFTTTLKRIIGENVVYEERHVSVFILEKFQKQYSTLEIVLLQLLPVYIIFFFLLFTCFPEVPGFIFRGCFKNKLKKNSAKDFVVGNFVEKNDLDQSIKSDEEERSCNSYFIDDEDGSEVLSNVDKLLKRMRTKEEGKEVLNNEGLNKFIKCFNFNENSDEVFTSGNSKMNNDSGLKFLRGMRGFFMLNYSIGLVFYVLLDSPLKIYNPEEVRNLIISSTSFAYLVTCFRACPKILLTISGFSFCYKFLSYLEKRKDCGDNLDHTKSVNLGHTNTVKSYKVSNKDLFRFLFRFSYKFLLYALYDLIFKFSFMFLVAFSQPGPMLVYCKKYMIGEINTARDVIDFLGRLFFLGYLYEFDIDSMDIFWYVRNEIVLFVVCSICVYYAYQMNWRLDEMLLKIFLLVFSVKIFYFLLMEFTTKEPVITTSFLYFSKFGLIFSHPFFNLSFYCLGSYFGLCNYIVQKSLTQEDIKGKNYLTFAFKFINFMKKRTKWIYLLMLFCVIIIIANTFIFQIGLTIKGCGNSFQCLEELRNDFYIRMFSLINTDTSVSLIFLCFFRLVVLSSNFLSKFLKHDLWTFLSRIFYSYSMVSMVMIIYVYYQSESRINIDFFNILFFSIFTTCIVVLFSAFSFVIVEIPLKRLNMLIIDGQRNDNSSSYNVNKHNS